MDEERIRKGEQVMPTGYGRTATWPRTYGRVTRATQRGIFVVWDGTHFEDQMQRAEVERTAWQPISA